MIMSLVMYSCIHVVCMYKHVQTCFLMNLVRLCNKDQHLLQKEFDQEVGMMAKLGAHPSIVLLLGVSSHPLALIFECLPYSLLYVRTKPSIAM